MPASFPLRPVASAAEAAAYVDRYVEALGIGGVRANRVLGFPGVYWVYVVEGGTGRSAFSLTVRADGNLAAREFPSMNPEMMWNQKYGHQARPDLATLEEDVSPPEAEEIVRRALPGDVDLRPGEASRYYGYDLFPLCEKGRPVGEAAVNAVSGELTWRRFPKPLQSAWAAPGVKAFCE